MLRLTPFARRTSAATTPTRAAALPFALVLSGCGVYDGSEIHEATSCLIHISRLGRRAHVFSPFAPQAHTVNHQAADVDPVTASPRLMHEESARIARGPVLDLDSIDASAYAGLILPGGFGCMKNLCNFGIVGFDVAQKRDGRAVVRSDVARAIKTFHAARKPIGAACIAPVLLAATLGSKVGGPGVLVTLGADTGDAVSLASSFGNRLIACRGSSSVNTKASGAVVVDEAQRIVTTPAYMIDDASPMDVFQGIGQMIEWMHQ